MSVAVRGETTSIELSIIIVSHNTREMTIACLDSLQKELSLGSTEIIVVDTASRDGTPQAIADHPVAPRLITLQENIGFARANNIAAGIARGRHLLFLNPDTVVLDRAVDRLLEFARLHPEAGIWGGRTLFADGSLNPSSCWQRMTTWNLLCRATGLTGLCPASPLFNGEAYGGWQRDSMREVDIVSGCFLLIARELWDRLDGFDPLYFMYGEDADLCLRARRLGARPLMAPSASIVHHGGASERVRSEKLEKLLAAKITLIDRHWPGFSSRVGRALLMLWPASRAVILPLLARISNDAGQVNAAATWRQVWTRRAHWSRGYRTKAGLTPTGRRLVTAA
jgi:GT2 family glycosyltransferase